MKNWDRLSRAEILKIQNKKLQAFINQQLYPFSPHYYKLFRKNRIDPGKIKRVEDLKYIPFTTKEDLLPTKDNGAKYTEFILQPDEEKIKKFWSKRKLFKSLFKGGKSGLEKEYRPIFLTATTGRTYQPISFLYSDHDILNLRKAGRRLVEVCGIKKEDRAVNVFPYAPHLAFWQVVFGAMEYGILALSTGGGKVMGTRGNIKAIEKIKPQLLVGVPGYVYHLLRCAHEEKCDLSFVKRIALGAEKVPLGLKEKMNALLLAMGAPEVKIFSTYAFTEARMAWVECPTELSISSGYHTYPDLEVFEVINPDTGEVLGEGQDGELVYTCIDGRGSCVLRYRTGDRVTGGLSYEPCPHCGRTVPRISGSIYRVSNLKEFNLTKIKGTLVNLNIISELLLGNKYVEEWCLEIRKKNDDPLGLDELVLYLTPQKNADLETTKQSVYHALIAETEIGPNRIEILTLEQILDKMGMESELKEKRIIDLRPK